MKKDSCLVCGAKEFCYYTKDAIDFEYGVPGKFDLVRCVKCGLISLWPTPTQAKLSSFYPESYHCYNVLSSITQLLSEISLRRQAALFGKLIGKKGKILDVGSANGKHFDFLGKQGQWSFTGVEINKRMVDQGRAGGRDIRLGTIETLKDPLGSYDLIIMDHLLEHVVNPVSTLKAAAKLLKKGGYLIGTTPNTKSLDAWIAGKYWGGLHIPRHTFLFNEQNIKRILEKNGFDIKTVNSEYHTGHWALSVQNFLQTKYQLRLTNGRIFYYPVLLILFLPLNLVQKIFHLSGIMSFVARKKD